MAVPRSRRRALLLFGALLLVAGGVAWSLLGEVSRDAAGLPASGYVSSVRRDSLGCETWIPFAAKDCRFIVRIHHHVSGTSGEQTYVDIQKYRFLPPPSLAGGDPVTGSCGPTGRCRFDQLAGRPWGFYGVLLSALGILGVLAWLYRRPSRSARATP